MYGFYLRPRIHEDKCELASCILGATVLGVSSVAILFLFSGYWEETKQFWVSFVAKMEELRTLLLPEDKEYCSLIHGRMIFKDHENDIFYTEYRLRAIAVKKLTELASIVTVTEKAKREIQESLNKQKGKLLNDELNSNIMKRLEDELGHAKEAYDSAIEDIRKTYELCGEFKLINTKDGYSPYYVSCS